MKILCIGESPYNTSLLLAEYPTENTVREIKSTVSTGGGISANSAYLLGKWGMDVSFAGVIGYDSFGAQIKKEFQDVNVDTTYLDINYEAKTAINFILINAQNGKHTLLSSSEGLQLKKAKINLKSDVILLDGYEYEASKFAITSNQGAISIIIADNTSKEILELCKMVKYIICTEKFAESVSGMKIDYGNPNSLASIFLDLKTKYKNSEIIINLEESGVLYAFNQTIKILPSLKLTPKDTTGVVDVFVGAFTYCIANAFDIEKTIKFSNIAAGLSVTRVGARFAIPELKEVTEYYEKH